jgi:alpha-L-fucosidase
MWDSAYTDYDMMSTPYKHDICKELSDACHKRGIRVLWYYSVLDMHEATYDKKNPKPYEDFLCNQIEELMTKYAPIEGIWWDGGTIKINKERVLKMMNTIHQGAMTNGRIGPIPCGVSFGTPEQRTGAFQMGRPWETCAVMGGSWIWSGGKYVKPIDACLQMLVNCAIGDGNLLLNFGPSPDGTIIPKVKENYLAIGSFLKKYGESIYKTRGGPYKPGHWGGATRHGKTVYLHILQKWPVGELKLPPLPGKVVHCEALTGGKPVCKQTADGLTIKLDPKDHAPLDTIIKLTLDSDAMAMTPITTQTDKSLALDAKASCSSSVNPRCKRGAPETVVLYSFETGKHKKEFGEEGSEVAEKISHQSYRKWDPKEKERLSRMVARTHRGHFWRYWRPKTDDKTPWIALDMGRPVTFQKVWVRKLNGELRDFEIQAEIGGKWETFYKGHSMEDLYVHLKKPVTAQRVRLVITGYNGTPPAFVIFDLFK